MKLERGVLRIREQLNQINLLALAKTKTLTEIAEDLGVEVRTVQDAIIRNAIVLNGEDYSDEIEMNSTPKTNGAWIDSDLRRFGREKEEKNLTVK